MSSDLDDLGVNPSANATFLTILAARLSRREVLQGGLAAAAVALLGRPVPAPADSLLGFTSVPVSTADTVVVPPGYTADVLYR